MLTWIERLEIIEELRNAKQRQARAPNEHDQHLRDSGGIGSVRNIKIFYPDPYSNRLLDFTEHLRNKYDKDGA